MSFGEDVQVTRKTRQAIIVALWLPVVIVLFGASVAFAIGAYRVARYAPVPTEGFGGAIDPSLAAVAVAGAVGFLYLALTRATLGGDVVDESLETIEQYREEYEDDNGGDSSGGDSGDGGSDGDDSVTINGDADSS
jgi:hypothetical protein